MAIIPRVQLVDQNGAAIAPGAADFTATNSRLDTTNTALSTLGTKTDTTNSKLDLLATYQDGLETAASATNTALGTLTAKFPTALGQLTKTASLSVAPASDYVPPLSPLQAQESRPAADGAAYYATARDGSTAIQLSSLSAGIKTLEIFAIGSNVWFKLGTSTVTAPTPTVDTTTAPRYLPQGSSVLVSVGSSTHLSLNGTGISLPWWLT